jgi:hypothetical protein
VAILLLASDNPVSRAMFFFPHIALDSVMACRAFRELKLGLFEDIDESTAKSKSIHFARNPALSMGTLSDTHDPEPMFQLALFGSVDSQEHVDEESGNRAGSGMLCFS